MIVVTGGHGSLATHLQPSLPAHYPSHQELDVADIANCMAYFAEYHATIIVHLAAETSATAPSHSYLENNIIGTANITRCAIQSGARLVYTSTDYVYPGEHGRYHETSPLQPIGQYAASKLAGELAVRQWVKSLVIRGSWYDQLSYAQAPTDAFTSRIPVTTAAAIIGALVVSKLTGIINVGGKRRTLYEIVQREFNHQVRGVKRSAIQSPYPFPADVSLDISQLSRFLIGATECVG